MVNKAILPLHSGALRRPVVDVSLPPVPSSAFLTDPRGTGNRSVRVSPRELAAWLQKEATTHNTNQIRLTDPIAIEQIGTLGNEMAKFNHRVDLSVTLALEAFDDHFIKVPSALSGIRLVEWFRPQGSLESIVRVLKIFSKSGIWNHVRISPEKDHRLMASFMRFAVANPNIVHSWEFRGNQRASVAGQPSPREIAISKYSRYPHLPGRPFWQSLPGPAHLLHFLSKYALQQVRRWWMPARGDTLTTLGENLSYHIVTPQALPERRLDEICAMVAAGGSVRTKYVLHNLQRAFLIAYVTEMGAVVANSSLKHPRPQFMANLKKQTGIDFSGYLERGYTSVRPEYRGMGLATRLLDGLTSRAAGRKVFSLISDDNIAAQKIAQRNRTRKISTFISRHTGKPTGIWMPEAMIDDAEGTEP